MSLSGFFNAPVSKGLLLVTLGATLLTHVADAPEHAFQLHLPGLLSGQLWRWITSQLAFGSAGELFVGLLLSYSARTFERHMGSRRFGTFLATTGVFGVGFQTAALVLFPTLRRLSPGPYASVFAVLVLYYASAPKLQPRLFGAWGLDFSEKSLTYLLALQIAFSNGPQSLVPALSGILAGCAYRSDTLNLRRLRLPDAVVRLLGPLKLVFGSARPSGLPGDAHAGRGGRNGLRRGPGGMRNPAGREQLIGGGFGGGLGGGLGGGFGGGTGFRPVPTPAPAPEPPSEEDIQTIVGMGFDREAAEAALRRHGNNVERAINSILS